MGAGLDPKVIILMGFSNVIADAISMGLGDFLSSKAENDFIMHERKREAWYVAAGRCVRHVTFGAQGV